MAAIYDREFKSYFINISGYLFIALILAAAGIFTAATNLFGRYPNFELVLSKISLFYIFFIPILTMRSITDERRLRTDQLLYSLPMPLPSVVLGKYLAMISILLIPCLVLCIYPLILSRFGTVFFLTVYVSIAGYYLLGCAMIAIGMFMSSLTDNQVISFILAVAVFAAFALIPGLSTLIPSSALASLLAFSCIVVLIALAAWMMARSAAASAVIAIILELPLLIVFKLNPTAFEGLFQRFAGSLSLFQRLENFTEGIFDLASVIYYLSICVIFVFFTVQSMDKRRWS